MRRPAGRGTHRGVLHDCCVLASHRMRPADQAAMTCLLLLLLLLPRPPADMRKMLAKQRLDAADAAAAEGGARAPLEEQMSQRLREMEAAAGAR